MNYEDNYPEAQSIGTCVKCNTPILENEPYVNTFLDDMIHVECFEEKLAINDLHCDYCDMETIKSGDLYYKYNNEKYCSDCVNGLSERGE